MEGGKLGSLLKKKWPSNFLRENKGKPLSCDDSSICFWLKQPVAVCGTLLQKQTGTLPPPALSCMLRVNLLASVRHQAPLTPPPHLKPPWNIWRWSWGRYLNQIDENPIWVFRSYAERSNHPWPTSQHHRELGES